MENHDASKPQKVGVIGAGLAGLMIASLLERLGFDVSVYEKRYLEEDEDDKGHKDVFGAAKSATKRSINLALSYRGICALEEVGILEKVMEHAIRMPKRIIHNGQSIINQAYGKSDETLWSVGRQTINRLLAYELLKKKSSVKLFYGYTLLSIEKGGICVFTKNDRNIKEKFDLVIGADGAFSIVREHCLKISRTNFSRIFVSHGYKELTIPPKVDENGVRHYALSDPNGLHIWPKGVFMLIALPNPDKSFTATLFAPYVGEHGFNAFRHPTTGAYDEDKIISFFEIFFPDVSQVMPHLVEDYKSNPVGSLVTVKVNPWLTDKFLLMGDAAHAVVPFYGQGMNAAFEDALQFYRLLKSELLDPVTGKAIATSEIDLCVVAEMFQKQRIPSTDTLADLCVEHFHDMSSNTASLLYLALRRCETVLQEWFPNTFTSLYRMIAFTTIPYDVALRKSNQQNRQIQLLLGGCSVLLAGSLSTWLLLKSQPFWERGVVRL